MDLLQVAPPEGAKSKNADGTKNTLEPKSATNTGFEDAYEETRDETKLDAPLTPGVDAQNVSLKDKQSAAWPIQTPSLGAQIKRPVAESLPGDADAPVAATTSVGPKTQGLLEQTTGRENADAGAVHLKKDEVLTEKNSLSTRPVADIGSGDPLAPDKPPEAGRSTPGQPTSDETRTKVSDFALDPRARKSGQNGAQPRNQNVNTQADNVALTSESSRPAKTGQNKSTPLAHQSGEFAPSDLSQPKQSGQEATKLLTSTSGEPAPTEHVAKPLKSPSVKTHLLGTPSDLAASASDGRDLVPEADRVPAKTETTAHMFEPPRAPGAPTPDISVAPALVEFSVDLALSTDTGDAVFAEVKAMDTALPTRAQMIGMPAAALQSPETARSVAAQIAHATVSQTDGTVEVTLRPEELGRVSLSFQGDGNSMSVSLTADRPETLDLLRRNIGMLETELRDAGFDTLEFDFGNQPGHRDRADGGSSPGQFDDGLVDAEILAETTVTGPRIMASGRVDMRL